MKADMEEVGVAAVVEVVAEERMDMERVGLSVWCCRAVVAIAVGLACNRAVDGGVGKTRA